MSGSCVTMMMVMPTLVQFLKNSHDLDARAAVEIAGRLVGQHNFRIVDQRARDRDALLLATGKLARMMIFAALQTDRRQNGVSLFAQLRIRQAMFAVKQRQLDVFARRSARQQIKALKNETEFAIANVGQLIAIEPGNVRVIEKVTAGASADRDSRECS